jgi:hypothetical protein
MFSDEFYCFDIKNKKNYFNIFLNKIYFLKIPCILTPSYRKPNYYLNNKLNYKQL